MANITVVCPTCRTKLRLDAAHEDREVQCGSCAGVFVARAEAPSRWDDDAADDYDRAGRRSRRRRRDDPDDYDDYYEAADRRRRSEAGSGTALAGVILGVVSLLFAWCPCLWIVSIPLNVIGLICSLIGLAAPNRGMAIAGLTVNGLGLLIAAVIAFAGWGPGNNNRFGPWNNAAPAPVPFVKPAPPPPPGGWKP